MSNTWLTELTTKNPQDGYDLAVKLAQPDPMVREELRAIYERDANTLIEVSAVVATHFQSISQPTTTGEIDEPCP